ncbi:hypothetical protein H696_02281 [Fonticula alba]|uniref:Uncharacterized protein n=1 Tax=Fonticula alba TaxID=691883 RepID=A0A058ZBN0_FONAL|nr:hypothetical protein H696_02281 [Fonticula alba]KCV71336.1 hypothetical protein H696_02281 [Fonticula alba]|eukprot:XP_009494459.1 hypothetical protein H696_02281 [Fonticula alba]
MAHVGHHVGHHAHHVPAAPAADANAVILATAGYGDKIRFWEALSGICYRTIQHTNSHVNALAITTDKRFLAAAGHGSVRLYDLVHPTNSPILALDAAHPNANVTALGFQRDGAWMFTGSEDGTVRVWDLRAPPGSAAGASSGGSGAGASGGGAPSAGCQRNYSHRGGAVNSVVLHPNQAELASGTQAGSIKIWDLTANACSHELVPEEHTPIRSLHISADGAHLAAANDGGRTYVWRFYERPPQAMALPDQPPEAAELIPLAAVQAHNRYILRCLFSPDVRYLATTSADHTVRLFDVANNFTQVRPPLTGHRRWVWDCAFSADSAYLVTASSDKTARLWDLSTGETIRTYTGHEKGCTSIALNDYGQ